MDTSDEQKVFAQLDLAEDHLKNLPYINEGIESAIVAARSAVNSGRAQVIDLQQRQDTQKQRKLSPTTITIDPPIQPGTRVYVIDPGLKASQEFSV